MFSYSHYGHRQFNGDQFNDEQFGFLPLLIAGLALSVGSTVWGLFSSSSAKKEAKEQQVDAILRQDKENAYLFLEQLGIDTKTIKPGAVQQFGTLLRQMDNTAKRLSRYPTEADKKLFQKAAENLEKLITKNNMIPQEILAQMVDYEKKKIAGTVSPTSPATTVTQLTQQTQSQAQVVQAQTAGFSLGESSLSILLAIGGLFVIVLMRGSD